jgi:hypothetical protein
MSECLHCKIILESIQIALAQGDQVKADRQRLVMLKHEAQYHSYEVVGVLKGKLWLVATIK